VAGVEQIDGDQKRLRGHVEVASLVLHHPCRCTSPTFVSNTSKTLNLFLGQNEDNWQRGGCLCVVINCKNVRWVDEWVESTHECVAVPVTLMNMFNDKVNTLRVLP
jgi:hypothetical protein